MYDCTEACASVGIDQLTELAHQPCSSHIVPDRVPHVALAIKTLSMFFFFFFSFVSKSDDDDDDDDGEDEDEDDGRSTRLRVTSQG